VFGDKIAPIQAGFMVLTVIGVMGTKLFAQG
jgi:quaternary ammonium compound-resistance protein SugE